MKNALLALALFSFVGTTAFANNDPGKDGKKGKKSACTTEMKASCTKDMKGGMAGGSCCMKGAKTAAVKTAAAPVTKSL